MSDLPFNYRKKLISPEITTRLKRIIQRQILRNSLDWEDVLQSVRLKILTLLDAGKFIGNETDFLHWVSLIAKRFTIDLVRSFNRRPCVSLDQKNPSTEQTLMETVPDPFDESAALEKSDLLQQVKAALYRIEKQMPKRQYLKIWQGLVEGKSQSQIAQDLGLSGQCTVARRKAELIKKIAIELGLSETVQSRKQLQDAYQPSDEEW